MVVRILLALLMIVLAGGFVFFAGNVIWLGTKEFFKIYGPKAKSKKPQILKENKQTTSKKKEKHMNRIKILFLIIFSLCIMPIFAGLRIGGVGGVNLGGSLSYGGVGGVSLSGSKNNNKPTSSKNIYTEYSHILVEKGESLIINTNDIQSIVYVYYYKCLNHPDHFRYDGLRTWTHPSIMKDKPSGWVIKKYCRIIRVPYYIRIYTSFNVIDIKYDMKTYEAVKEFLKTIGYELLPPACHENPVFIEQ